MQISKKRLWLGIVGAVLVIIVAVITAMVFWYNSQLRPVDPSKTETVRIDIKQGMSASEVVSVLEDKGVIRSSLAVSIYLRLHGGGGGFQAGVYSVSPSQTPGEIIEHLSSGKSDEISVTFYPGAMLERADKDSADARYDVRTSLRQVGFSDQEISQAFKATYDSPVFAGRPSWAGLEGYIHGDTYFVKAGSSAEEVIQVAIDQFWRIVEQNGFEAKFASRGLSLYEGITLASIVERESIGCPGQAICSDQRNIASVFYNRLKIDMTLGSDVTYHYAADISGEERSYLLESLYNTRIHPGLPPGPIATPGLSALNAVADPAQTDYLFFLSGDDDVTYFATTEAGHNDNILKHCQQKCLLP